MIRLAKPEDFDAILEMAKKSVAETYFKDDCAVERMSEIIKNMTAANGHFDILLVSDDLKGFLIASINQFPFGSVPQATEIAWWVEPEARLQGVGEALRLTYEQWAKDNGCVRCTMCCLDDKVLQYYLKSGYKLYEYACAKEL